LHDHGHLLADRGGTRTGAVTLKDNCPGSPTQTITLSGTGETGPSDSRREPQPWNVPVGLSSTQSATVTTMAQRRKHHCNRHSPRRNVHANNNCPATLKVQQTCTFQIVFTPPDVFTYNATLSITNTANGRRI